MSNFKICSSCKIEKEFSEFSKNKSKSDGLQLFCKSCASEHFKKYYAENKEHHKKVISKRKWKHIYSVQQYVYDYLKNNGCCECKENDPACLDFDHVRGKKINIISKMVGTGTSLPKILEEIDKCVIRCANCHRKKTAKDQNWYKNIDKGSVTQLV